MMVTDYYFFAIDKLILSLLISRLILIPYPNQNIYVKTKIK